MSTAQQQQQQQQQQQANALVQRIMQESTRCQSNGWKVDMDEKNCGHWTLSMPIPEDASACPYAGCTFTLDVNILWDYPNTSPEITFRSDIFHPHFFNGCNCLGCNGTQRWSRHYSVTQALLAVRDMILEPYPRTPSPGGPISCLHHSNTNQPTVADVQRARGCFPDNIHKFVEQAINKHRDTKSLVNHLIGQKLWPKRNHIASALEHVYRRERTLARDVPFHHGPMCELNKRAITLPGVVGTESSKHAAAAAASNNSSSSSSSTIMGAHAMQATRGQPSTGPNGRGAAHSRGTAAATSGGGGGGGGVATQSKAAGGSHTPTSEIPTAASSTAQSGTATPRAKGGGGGGGAAAAAGATGARGANAPVVPSRLASARTSVSDASGVMGAASVMGQQQGAGGGGKRSASDRGGDEAAGGPSKAPKQGGDLAAAVSSSSSSSSPSALPKRPPRPTFRFSKNVLDGKSSKEALRSLLPTVDRSVVILHLQTAERLATDTIVCQNVDTPRNVKDTIAMNQIGVRVASGDRQSLRCAKCQHILRDDLELWQHRLQSSDIISMNINEQCNCSLFNLHSFKHRANPHVPSLKLLCKHALMQVQPSTLSEMMRGYPRFFLDYVRQPSPDSSIVAVPYFSTAPRVPMVSPTPTSTSPATAINTISTSGSSTVSTATAGAAAGSAMGSSAVMTRGVGASATRAAGAAMATTAPATAATSSGTMMANRGAGMAGATNVRGSGGIVPNTSTGARPLGANAGVTAVAAAARPATNTRPAA